ncbi:MULTISPECIES: aminopeptidase N [unclassified Gilliamella]|uniref:aminopeptidase N n=1 Tax=unclassified Gilliamella TaxID=2685620 RepID=UPI001328C93F|nr:MULTISPECIES: aminopeptidase N [unclassified Gilliamella]MWN32585.1 aminopeptidase N [Gilliamella sp. Pra-s60]MWP30025.1 aminopeptidase N [Gilliamella sp. Pra-s54]
MNTTTTQSQPKAKYRLDYQAPDFTITDIDLDFDLAPEITTVTARSHVIRKNNNVNDLILDGEDLKLISVNIDEQPWHDYQITKTGLLIQGVPAEFTLTIVNEIKPIDNTALEGLYVSGEALCTQCEAEGFRHITYYLDRPDVLARFSTRITANKQHYPYLLSNGNRVAQGDLSDGRHWVQWQDPFPKPAYLFALVAGDFDILKDQFITQSKRKVDLEIYVDKGNLERSHWAMTSLKNAMRWDETRFGLEYDLDIFMIVAVDFFNMGAMENKGLNIFNSKYVLAKPQTATDDDYLGIEGVIGHEYFHNWTGNRVTCRDWFQLSLKEGLTVFRDQEFSADLGSRAVKRIDDVKLMRTVQFAEDASPMSHPIRPDQVIEMNNFYTVTVYEKGAEVIRMMHTLLGEDKFQAGMKLYFKRHDGSAATCDDFVSAMQDASGIDLSQFKLWYSQSGTPELTVTDSYDEKTQQYTLTVEQCTKPTQDQQQKQALHIPLDIELYKKNGDIIALQHQGKPVQHVLNVTKEKQQFVFDNVSEKPIISLLRDFSAPVKLHYDYQDNDLIFLMQHATNAFSRYDAAQMLLAKYVRINVHNYQQNKKQILPEVVIDAFRAVLLSDSIDPALIAQILTLPSENELANLFTVVDPIAIHQVRLFFLTQFANQLYDELLAVYYHNKTTQYHIEHIEIAKRSLKNCCLSLLGYADNKTQINSLVTQQYHQSNNMTDCLAALSIAVKAELDCRTELLVNFDDKWHQDGLVMDKWLTLNATSPEKNVLATVKKLLTHRSFTLSNPNRIRALIGAFVNNNPVAFHAEDGSGYQFLVEILIELNQKNPQVAARLIDPLIRLKRYDENRQKQMRQSLEALLKIENLSKDLYEKINKALEA